MIDKTQTDGAFLGINHIFEAAVKNISNVVYDKFDIIDWINRNNIYLVLIFFVILSGYMFFWKKYRIRKSFNKPINYVIVIGLLVLSVFLSKSPFRLSDKIGLNLGLVLLPLIMELYGPLMACIFGILQYVATFMISPDELFSWSLMLLGGISGILYSVLLYRKKAGYIECLFTKLIINVVCNIVLIPLENAEVMSTGLAESISERILLNVLLVPLQAFIIYLTLRITRNIKANISKK